MTDTKIASVNFLDKKEVKTPRGMLTYTRYEVALSDGTKTQIEGQGWLYKDPSGIVDEAFTTGTDGGRIVMYKHYVPQADGSVELTARISTDGGDFRKIVQRLPKLDGYLDESIEEFASREIVGRSV